MNNKFSAIMAQKTTTELVEILEVKSAGYLPEALEAANYELKNRGISENETDDIVATIIINDNDRKKIINIFEKIFLCLYPIITFIVIYLSYNKENFTDKKEQLIKWFKYSLLFRLILVLLFVLLDLFFANT